MSSRLVVKFCLVVAAVTCDLGGSNRERRVVNIGTEGTAQGQVT